MMTQLLFSMFSPVPSQMPTPEQFVQAAAAVAPAWGLKPVAIEVLSHSENVVCRVGLPDRKQVVMRLHRPGYNSKAELESEVQWVASLAEADIPVPTALPMLNGGHYCPVDVGAGRDRERRMVGVVEWVEGSPLGGPLTNADEGVVTHYATIGKLAGKIREHHTGWDLPEGFQRRRWDLDGLLGSDPLWGRFWEVEALTASQRALFNEARNILRNELSELSMGPDRFGLIHSDLHLGNLMVDGDNLTVIDFDDAGFGWFSHELACALHPGVGEPWFADAREALVEGYRSVSPVTDEEIESIDTFLAVRSLMIVGWLDARPELSAHEYFPLVVKGAEAAARAVCGHS